MKLPGIYINRRKINNPRLKLEASKELYGWRYDSLELDSWLSDHIDQGHVVIIGNMNKCPDQKRYRHKKDLWTGTHVIAVDADEISYQEDGSTILKEGVPPFQGPIDSWIKKNPEICSKIYAIGESVTSMIKGYPPHRRFRLWFFCDEKIESEEAYNFLLKGLSSTFPIIPDAKRQPAQPVYGSCALYRIMTIKTEFSPGGVYEPGHPVSTIRLGNSLDKDQIKHYIELGEKMNDQEKRDRMPKKKERNKNGLVNRNRNGNGSTLDPIPEDNAVNRLGRNFEIARDFMEGRGSTFSNSTTERHEFNRSGKRDGGGEVLMIGDDGSLVFYAHSENSQSVLDGYCSVGEGIPFHQLYCDIEYEGYSFLQCMSSIIKEYPHLDTGWRPERKPFEELKPFTAINYDLDLVKAYITNHEDEEMLEIRKPRVVEPGFDDRIIVFWEDRWTLFSDYFAYVEDCEQENELLEDYDRDNPDHKDAYILLNNLAAQYTGNTGGWGQNQRNNRRSRTFYV